MTPPRVYHADRSKVLDDDLNLKCRIRVDVLMPLVVVACCTAYGGTMLSPVVLSCWFCNLIAVNNDLAQEGGEAEAESVTGAALMVLWARDVLLVVWWVLPFELKLLQIICQHDDDGLAFNHDGSWCRDADGAVVTSYVDGREPRLYIGSWCMLLAWCQVRCALVKILVECQDFCLGGIGFD
ncbi:hypothetical protein Nepgr_006638 [Nepenthes gracilis]|uniref:Uncharacterized protein n=1 Tax=Nepenthes gracilis TaxID=150966 RepID=A0AAD3XHJ6_NEPGR|nr:hypothetical protein Nepgr_006638 [Nepenthes gracilis]